MEKNENFNNNPEIQKKIDYMRNIVLDEKKCKEIAQKLCAYISKS